MQKWPSSSLPRPRRRLGAPAGAEEEEASFRKVFFSLSIFGTTQLLPRALGAGPGGEGEETPSRERGRGQRQSEEPRVCLPPTPTGGGCSVSSPLSPPAEPVDLPHPLVVHSARLTGGVRLLPVSRGGEAEEDARKKSGGEGEGDPLPFPRGSMKRKKTAAAERLSGLRRRRRRPNRPPAAAARAARPCAARRFSPATPGARAPQPASERARERGGGGGGAGGGRRRRRGRSGARLAPAAARRQRQPGRPHQPRAARPRPRCEEEEEAALTLPEQPLPRSLPPSVSQSVPGARFSPQD